MTQRNDIDDFFSSDRVAGREATIDLPTGSYTEYLHDLDDPVLAKWRGQGYAEFSATKREPDFVQELLASWRRLYDEPFVGITTDGTVREGLYRLPDHPVADDGAIVASADAFLAALDATEREDVSYPLDAAQWRAWSNPEFVIHEVGLRLEDLTPTTAEAALAVVRASLSPEGYQRVREAMALNGFLGELTDLPTIMNDKSYWFALYGTPSREEPWGWQLFGHHVALNFVTVGGRHVLAPVFLGAEPALSDGARPPLFEAREQLAIELAQSLTEEQRAQAVVYHSVLDPAMPEGRVHPADERHVAGAFRDNRVVPTEGIRCSSLDERQRGLVRTIVADFLGLLTEPQQAAALADVDAHLGETSFSWYGATDGSQPFYFRIHGPVFLGELDHHAGVWLNNRLPARFHVHTTMRLPHGNDYAKAYLAEWQRRHSADQAE